jgi:hypothetical protein
MIKLTDILNEVEEGFLSNMFGKKAPEPQKQPTQAPKKPQGKEYVVDEVPVTVEGISNDGKGYTVWAGNSPIGDLRQELASKGGSGYGEKGDKVYYYVSDLTDHVGRDAYFTVSAPNNNPSAKKVIKDVADQILKRKQRNGINTHDLNLS